MTRQRLLAAALTGALAIGPVGCATDPDDEAVEQPGGADVVDPGTDTGATGEGFDDVETEGGGG